MINSYTSTAARAGLRPSETNYERAAGQKRSVQRPRETQKSLFRQWWELGEKGLFRRLPDLARADACVRSKERGKERGVRDVRRRDRGEGK